jgi:hypothetical protein
MARATEARARRLFRSRERFFGRNVEMMAEHYGDPNASVLLDRTLRQPNRGGELEARGLYRNLLVTGLLDQRGELARRRRVLSQCRTGQGILRSEERTG